MKLTIKCSVLFGLIFCFSCSAVKYQEDIIDYQEEIQSLRFRIQENAEDAEAIRDLGAIFFQVRRYYDAKVHLKQAARLDPRDPKTMFYLGLSAEFDTEEEQALEIYRLYKEVSRLSPYRKLMEGRYHWLTRSIARREARNLLRGPMTIQHSQIDQDAIAVFPMIYRGSEEQYAVLGRGLSEMILIDLGNVDGVRLVERIRIQALLDELAFAKSRYVDPETSPRYGRILGAGKMVSGVYNVWEDSELEVDASSWDVIQHELPFISSKDDLLENLFALEKELVMDILQKLGLEPTAEEQDSIMTYPTRNLQAFLLYSLGLEREDAGDFRQAIDFYEKALKADPNFRLAAAKNQRAASLRLIGGSKEKAKRVALKEGEETDEKAELVGERLGKLSNSVGVGGERRSPVDDAVNSGLFDETLPEPPPPPQR